MSHYHRKLLFTFQETPPQWFTWNRPRFAPGIEFSNSCHQDFIMSSLECDVLAVMSEWSVEYPTDQLERWEEVWDWIFEKTYCLKEKYVVTRSGEAVSRDCCDGFLDPYSTRETHWLVERHSTPVIRFPEEVREHKGHRR
ncbi:uncharacterized protein LOC124293678 [Neodiprion lecontei]|uniref:Uncharacterized protein LOC124293678 n=1 Tax=Neodiprion lecontei TaxID=441921 RepID=A0ABM3FU49_NEOLC|nr:uncharacterized protein LOC124293678 [Neodiprion lecontei]